MDAGDIVELVGIVYSTGSGSVFGKTADELTAILNLSPPNPNSAPVADPQSLAVNEDGSLAITLSGSDVDGDLLSYSVTSAPASGSLSGTAPSLTYTPNGGFSGSDSFSFVVNDGSVDSVAATVSITVNVVFPDVRVTEYYLTTGDFSNTTATLTLSQDLADDYFILIRGSRTGDGTSNPNNDYARVISVPGGKGDLAASGASDMIGLQRQVADFDWEGVVTVVECVHSASAAGFRLVDAVDTLMDTASGTDTGAAWSDLARVVLFGGDRGGGVEIFGSPINRKEGTGCYVCLYPSGTNTLNWSRNAGGEMMFDSAAAGSRFGWGTNGCKGTGAAFPQPRFWARFTADTTVTISRGYDGQNFPAWIQGIDLSGLNE